MELTNKLRGEIRIVRTFKIACTIRTFQIFLKVPTGLINYQKLKKLQIFKIWNSVYTSKSMSPHYNFHRHTNRKLNLSKVAE